MKPFTLNFLILVILLLTNEYLLSQSLKQPQVPDLEALTRNLIPPSSSTTSETRRSKASVKPFQSGLFGNEKTVTMTRTVFVPTSTSSSGQTGHYSTSEQQPPTTISSGQATSQSHRMANDSFRKVISIRLLMVSIVMLMLNMCRERILY